MNKLLKKSSSFKWNMIASLVNASEAVVVLMVATRCVGLSDSGILSIAFTIANLMMIIGKYGMKNYQVTDLENNFSFKTYYYSRIYTIMIMSIVFIAYMVYGYYFSGYSLYKITIIFGVFLLYGAEVYEDLYWGAYQKIKRLYIGAKIFSIRWIITIIVWCLFLIISKNTIFSIFVAVFFDWIYLFFAISRTKSILEKSKYRKNNVLFLLKKCFPLALSSLLCYYITNASKYAIDGLLSDDIQACFGFVSMPVFVIGLLNMILYQPILVYMTEEWNNKNYIFFVKRILRQTILLFGVSIFCILGAWLIGIPVLSLIYGVNLKGYRFEMIILLIAGLWLALSEFYMAVLTIMRKTKGMLIIYLIVSLLALIFTPKAIMFYGTKGAAFINMIWNFLVALIFVILMSVEIYKTKRIK